MYYIVDPHGPLLPGIPIMFWMYSSNERVRLAGLYRAPTRVLMEF